MIREIKTTLLGESPRTDGGTPTIHRDDARAARKIRRAPHEESNASGSAADLDVGRESIPLNQLFDVLGDERRRSALRLLCEYDEPVAMADLAERVAAREEAKAIAELSPRTLERVQVSMHHAHLPKMDEADAVSYDTGERTVEPGDRFDEFVDYLSDDA